MSELKLFPSWRQAAKELIDAGLEPGKIIAKSDLERLFGITPAQTIAELERNRMLWLRNMSDLRDALLREHCVMLMSVPGIGYRLVEPEQQTSTALAVRGRAIALQMGRLHDDLTYIKVDALTDDQRKENTDALARVGVLMGMANKQLNHGGASPGESRSGGARLGGA